MQQLSFPVVGTDHASTDEGDQRLEILLSAAGEPIELVPDPKNLVDPNATVLFRVRRFRIGCLTADRAPWIGEMLRSGCGIRAIYQKATPPGAAVRFGFGGRTPVPPGCYQKQCIRRAAEDIDFWPDQLPLDA